VQVDGYLPPGVRRGQRFDIQVSALPKTAPVARAGDLAGPNCMFGANPADPGGGSTSSPAPKGRSSSIHSRSMPTRMIRGRATCMGVILNSAASLQDLRWVCGPPAVDAAQPVHRTTHRSALRETSPTLSPTPG
jgi:hypothetical protein